VDRGINGGGGDGVSSCGSGCDVFIRAAWDCMSVQVTGFVWLQCCCGSSCGYWQSRTYIAQCEARQKQADEAAAAAGGGGGGGGGGAMHRRAARRGRPRPIQLHEPFIS
jgi:hypothetical protein